MEMTMHKAFLCALFACSMLTAACSSMAIHVQPRDGASGFAEFNDPER
jgi:hypothetical protein